MGGDAEAMAGGQWHAGDPIGVPEGAIEDDTAAMHDGDRAARLLGEPHLILDPLRHIVERGFEPRTHVPSRHHGIAPDRQA